MASFRQMADGRWRAEIARGGVRKSKILPSKRAAKDWAAFEELQILNAKPIAQAITFGEVMQRYANEESPKKRGERWEVIRLNRFMKDPIAAKRLAELEDTDFIEWRDLRLAEVKPASVRREMNLMSAVLNRARKPWKLIDVNPMVDVEKPPKSPARDRIVSDPELEALETSAGVDLGNATARAFHAFKFAIETAMRAGEIIGLTWDNIDLQRQVAHLPMTKNGTARNVPLSRAAVALLEDLPRADPVFGLDSGALDALWRKLRDRAAVKDLTFHDSRHIAITRLSKKLEVLDLARMVGHRNINELLTYYNETAEEIAKRLD